MKLAVFWFVKVFGKVSRSTVGGVRSTTQVKVASVLVLLAASVWRTRKVCEPSIRL